MNENQNNSQKSEMKNDPVFTKDIVKQIIAGIMGLVIFFAFMPLGGFTVNAMDMQGNESDATVIVDSVVAD